MQFFERVAALERDARRVRRRDGRRPALAGELASGRSRARHADGRMEGFVGGSCSRDIVRRHALLAIRARQTAAAADPS